MATTLEELVVKLKADIKDYQKGLSKSLKITKKVTNKIKKAFNKVKGTIGGAAKGLMSLKGAIVGAGIGILVTKTFEAADRMAKLSKNIGVNSDLLQELSFAASQTGVSQEDLNASMMRFNRRIGEAVSGNAAYKKAYEDLGITLTDTSGKLRSSEEILFEVADAVGGLGSEAEQAKTLFNLFGDSGFRLVNLFKGGAPALEDFQKQAKELGIVLGADVLSESEKVNDELDKMKRVIGAELTRLFVSLAPAIKLAANALIEITRALSGMAEATSKAWSTYKALFGFGEAAERVNFLNEAIAIVKKRLDDLNEGKVGLFDYVKFWKDKGEKVEETKQKLAEYIAERDKLMQSMDAEKEKQRELDELKAAAEEKRKETGAIKDEDKLKEIEKLVERNDILAGLNNKQFRDERATNKKKIDAFIKAEDEKIAAGKVASNQYLKIKKNELQKELALRSAAAQGAQTFFSNMMTLTKGKSKALFEISKAASIATAVIQGILGVQRTLASVPFPVNIPLAAAQASMAAVNVARIASTNFAKGTTSVPGIGSTDSVPAMLMPRERVVPTSTNQDLTSFLEDYKELKRFGTEGGENGIVIRLEMNDDFMEMIDARIVERGKLNVALEA